MIEVHVVNGFITEFKTLIMYVKLNVVNIINIFFMFAPCINSIKALFINPTDAHSYKITGMLKQLKFSQLLRHVSVHSGTIIREPLRA